MNCLSFSSRAFHFEEQQGNVTLLRNNRTNERWYLFTFLSNKRWRYPIKTDIDCLLG